MTEASTIQSPEPKETEHEHTPTQPDVPPVIPPPGLFDKDDLTYFGAEDRHAGGVIGKMLSLFFFYTVIVMLLVAIWTFFAATH